MADTIIPLHFFDDTPLWRAFILYSMFVFDDVLDPPKLRDGLESVTRLKAWQKLGARLRSNIKGELEYHIPQEFTPDRPGLAYTHIQYETAASEHPVASRIPRPSTQPAVVGDPDEFRTLFHPPNGPTKLDDYLTKDIPQLGLHIISFADKTFVCLYFPHTLMDALGTRVLLDAWTLMLQGRAEEILSPYGTAFDPLASLGKNPTEPHELVNQQMSLFGLALYGVSNVLDFFRTQENRMVCIPGPFLSSIREKAIEELAAAGVEDPFLTEGDVLVAWWTRLAISHLPHNSQRTLVLNNAYSLRNALATDLLPSGQSYASNAIGFINVLLPVHEVFDKPLSYLAAAMRHAVNGLGKRSQVEAFASMWRESYGKLPPFFGDWRMHMLTYSNWSKAKFFETDFSAVVLKAGKTSRNPGTPSYIQNNQFGLVLPNAFPIVGKDAQGNYWLSGYLNKGHWEAIEKQLAKIPYGQ